MNFLMAIPPLLSLVVYIFIEASLSSLGQLARAVDSKEQADLGLIPAHSKKFSLGVISHGKKLGEPADTKFLNTTALRY